MIANIPWIETKYKEFNQKYWKNELAIPEFKTNNSKNNFGRACLHHKKTIPSERYTLIISTYYDRPVEDLESTLLHEMIHIYEYQFHFPLFKNRKYDFHGYFFLKEADRLNQYGYNVTKTISGKQISNYVLSEKAEKSINIKMKRGYYAVCFEQKDSTKYHVCKLNEKMFHDDLQSLIDAMIETEKYENVKVYHTFDKYLLNRRSSVKSYWIIDESKIQDIKNNGKLIQTVFDLNK